MSKIVVTLPDNSKLNIEKGQTVLNVAELISPSLAKAAIAGKVDGELVDLSYVITKNSKVEIITTRSDEAFHILNHSAAHILASAVVELFPDAKPTIGPAVEEGFYYDFAVKKPFSQEDLEKIEQKMIEIIEEDSPFIREEVNKNEAIEYYSKKQKNKFKVEILEDMEETEKVSFYIHANGKFKDLCRGPHVPSTKYVRAVKLLNVSSAFWRGDSSRESLQRIYGIAFFDKKKLKKHLQMLEEAKKRDHRILGPQLDLFDTADEWGPGMPLIYPKGAQVLEVMKAFWKKEHVKAGYKLVQTPHLFKEKVWQTSGHINYYLENMYPVDARGERWYVKPMNCPGHMMIFNRKSYSYRELPERLAEMGTVYRYEMSGVLHGLFRVRGFTQDDSHIFMLPEQLEDEIVSIIRMVNHFYTVFGFDEWEFFISTRPKKSIGTDEGWEHATKALMNAVSREGINYKIKEGDGAFYGPKIDVAVKDAIGRKWQLATIQVDFNLPERFDINYVGEDGQKHRPLVIHRVIYGALERFLAILVEHYAGKLPIWLSPVQVMIIPITDDFSEYAKKVAETLVNAGLRAETDLSGERMEYKIRQATIQKIPYIINVGAKEVQNNTIAVRDRTNKVKFGVKVEDFVNMIKKQIAEYH